MEVTGYKKGYMVKKMQNSDKKSIPGEEVIQIGKALYISKGGNVVTQ